MITKLGEVSGGVSGGKRGLLRLNSNVSLPLRKILYDRVEFPSRNLQFRTKPYISQIHIETLISIQGHISSQIEYTYLGKKRDENVIFSGRRYPLGELASVAIFSEGCFF